jgi:hypothetical protein
MREVARIRAAFVAEQARPAEQLAVPRCQCYMPAVAGSGSSTAKVVER